MSGNCGKILSLRTSSMEKQSSFLFKQKRNSSKQKLIFVHSFQNIIELSLANVIIPKTIAQAWKFKGNLSSKD
jgi:hypothetical protein